MSKLLLDRILVRVEPAEEKNAGGLYMGKAEQPATLKGEVIAVGTGKRDEPMEVDEGDVIMFGAYNGTPVVVNGETLIVLRQSEVLLIL